MNPRRENVILIIEYINQREIFWLMELRDLLGVDTSNKYDKDIRNSHISQFIQILVKKNLIQCSEKRSTNRQYITLRKIKIEDIWEK